MYRLHNMKSTEHDNSVEMWEKYYTSKRGVSFFEKTIHFARKGYFGGAFARTVLKLGGKKQSYLETGVGTGQTLERLQNMTGARCVGVEKTPTARDLGLLYAKHCEIILGDALKLPLPDKSFDVSYHLDFLSISALKNRNSFYGNKPELQKMSYLLKYPPGALT